MLQSFISALEAGNIQFCLGTETDEYFSSAKIVMINEFEKRESKIDYSSGKVSFIHQFYGL